MYTSVMNKSLALNKRFVKSLTATQLEDLMKEFDDYEIERCDSGFYNQETPQQYWHSILKFFDKNKRKSVNLEDDKKEDLSKVLFSYLYFLKKI